MTSNYMLELELHRLRQEEMARKWARQHTVSRPRHQWNLLQRLRRTTVRRQPNRRPLNLEQPAA